MTAMLCGVTPESAEAVGAVTGIFRGELPLSNTLVPLAPQSSELLRAEEERGATVSAMATSLECM